jgi:hypothetical protein
MNSPSSSSPALTGRGWSFGGTRLQREGSSQLAIAADRAAAVEDPPDAVDLTEAQLEAFVGHWRASMGIEVEIVREDEGLVFIQAGTRARLVAAAPDRILLRAANIDMRLSDLRDGRFHSMSVAQNGQAFSAERFNPRPEPERDPASYRGTTRRSWTSLTRFTTSRDPFPLVRLAGFRPLDGRRGLPSGSRRASAG